MAVGAEGHPVEQHAFLRGGEAAHEILDGLARRQAQKLVYVEKRHPIRAAQTVAEEMRVHFKLLALVRVMQEGDERGRALGEGQNALVKRPGIVVVAIEMHMGEAQLAVIGEPLHYIARLPAGAGAYNEALGGRGQQGVHFRRPGGQARIFLLVAVVNGEIGGFALGVRIAARQLLAPMRRRAGEIMVERPARIVRVVRQMAGPAAPLHRAAEQIRIFAAHGEGVGADDAFHERRADDGFYVPVGLEIGAGAAGEGFDDQPVRLFLVPVGAENSPGHGDGGFRPRRQQGAQVQPFIQAQKLVRVEKRHPFVGFGQGAAHLLIRAELVVRAAIREVEHADIQPWGHGAGDFGRGVGRGVVQQEDGIESGGELPGDPFADMGRLVPDDGHAADFTQCPAPASLAPACCE